MIGQIGLGSRQLDLTAADNALEGKQQEGTGILSACFTVVGKWEMLLTFWLFHHPTPSSRPQLFDLNLTLLYSRTLDMDARSAL